jgi:syntaxin 5
VHAAAAAVRAVCAPAAPHTPLCCESWLSSAQAVDSVHATIAELGGIFQQLTAMVAEQGSRLQRVDENLDDSVSNVTEGHAQLLRYWSNLRSSRGLMMRVFAILLFFIVVWGTLFA